MTGAIAPYAAAARWGLGWFLQPKRQHTAGLIHSTASRRPFCAVTASHMGAEAAVLEARKTSASYRAELQSSLSERQAQARLNFLQLHVC